DPSCPPVKGRLDSKTSIEKEGRKPENVYGLPLTGGREGVLPLTWLTLGQTVMEMDAGIGLFSCLLETETLRFCKTLIVNVLQYLCFYIAITMLLHCNNYAFRR
ncbi:MAG: hypothetical protein MR912_12225, partial [Prevotella sp.]|nr:hypothetical protein [Prevotella sp.]